MFGKKLSFWLSACSLLFHGAVALNASFFPFDILDGRSKVIVSISVHCFPFFSHSDHLMWKRELVTLFYFGLKLVFSS